MPGYDRTGPSGEGPMTGGMRGYCSDNRKDDRYRPNVFQRLGRGLGFGYGMRNRINLRDDVEPSELEKKSTEDIKEDVIDRRLGLGPCGDEIPRGLGRRNGASGRGRGFGRGFGRRR